MKNLYKKLGAIALAGMVVAGGFAASGAQSFAAYGRYHGGIKFENEIEEKDEGSKELEKMIGYSNFKVSQPFYNGHFLKDAVQEEYPSLRRSNSIIGIRPGSKMLRNIARSGNDVIMVRFKSAYYAIVKASEVK